MSDIQEKLQGLAKAMTEEVQQSFSTVNISERLEPYLSKEELSLPFIALPVSAPQIAKTVGFNCAGAEPTEEEIATLTRSIDRAKLVGWVTYPLHKITYSFFPPAEGPTLGEIATSIKEGKPIEGLYKSETRCIIISYPIYQE